MMITCPSTPVNRRVRSGNHQQFNKRDTKEAAGANIPLILPGDDNEGGELSGYIVGTRDTSPCSSPEKLGAAESLILFPAPQQIRQTASEDSHEQQPPFDQQQLVFPSDMKAALSPRPVRKEKISGGNHRNFKRQEKSRDQGRRQDKRERNLNDNPTSQDICDEDIVEDDVVLLAENDDLMTDVHVLVQEYEALKQENALLLQECNGYQQDLRVAQSELNVLRTASQENSSGVRKVIEDAWDQERQLLKSQLKELRTSRDKWKKRAFRVKEQCKQQKSMKCKEDARSVFFKAKFLSNLCPPCHVHALISLGEPIPDHLRRETDEYCGEHENNEHSPPKRNVKSKSPCEKMVSGIPTDICIQEHDGRLDDGMSALPSLAGVTTIHHQVIAPSQQPRTARSKPINCDVKNNAAPEKPAEGSAFMEKQKSKRHRVLSTREALAKAVRIVNEIKPDGKYRSTRRRAGSRPSDHVEDDDRDRSASDAEWDLEDLHEKDDENSQSSLHESETRETSKRNRNPSRASSGTGESDNLDRDHHGKNHLKQRNLSSFLTRDSKDSSALSPEQENTDNNLKHKSLACHDAGSGGHSNQKNSGGRTSRASASLQHSKSSSSETRTASTKWSSNYGPGEEQDEIQKVSQRNKAEATATTTSSSRGSSGRQGSSSGRPGVQPHNPLNTMIIIEEEQPHMPQEHRQSKHFSRRMSRLDLRQGKK